MSIRLNKAIRELNIGLQTAVEFLEKKSHLGEVRADLSFKLNDEQYEALREQFQKDKEVRTQAEKLFQKHPKEKKKPAEPQKVEKATTETEAKAQQFKPLGKIDLSSIGKKPAESVEKPVKEEPKAAAVSPKAEVKPVVEKKEPETQQEPKVEVVPESKPVVEEKKPEPKAEPEQTVEEVAVEVEKEQEAPVEEPTAPAEPEVFTLKSEQKLRPR